MSNSAFTYKDILDNTYVMPETVARRYMPNANEALKVRQKPYDRCVYVYRLNIGGFIDMVSPLQMCDLMDCGKSFKQFERDYMPKYWNADEERYSVVYDFDLSGNKSDDTI